MSEFLFTTLNVFSEAFNAEAKARGSALRAKAIEVYGAEDAEKFLTSPSVFLNKRIPLKMSASSQEEHDAVMYFLNNVSRKTYT